MLSPLLRYSILRILAFAVALFLLALIPWMRENLLVLVIVAATVSMLFSLFFFNGPRDEMSARIAERVEHRVEVKHAHEAQAHRHGQPRGQHADEAAEDAEIAAGGEQYR